MLSDKAFIDEIQYLRAVAAISVAIFHISISQSIFFPDHKSVIPLIHGLWGVDIFFVISGFIMTLITQDVSAGKKQAIHFLKNRVMRIVPAYWFFTLLMFFLTILLEGLFSNINTYSLKQLIYSLFFLEIHRFPVLLVGWTLNFEMFFYLLYGLSILFINKNRALFNIFILVILFATGVFVNSENRIINFYTNSIILEFALGIFIAWLYINNKFSNKSLALCLLALGIGMLTVSFILFAPDEVIENRLLYWGLPSSLVVWGILNISHKRSYAKLKYLGDISYSIYLSHLPVLLLLATGIKLFLADTPNPNVILVTLAVPGIFLASALSHRWVESAPYRFIHK